MTPTQIEKEILKQMKLLNLTREEATELVMEDLEIDHMAMKELTNDLTAEQKKNIKKMTNTTAVVTKKSGTRERKKDEIKLSAILTIYNFLVSQNFESCEIIKPERQIDFKIDNENYSLTLTKHRKKEK